MPTPKYFSRCPAFPDVPVANIPTLSFKNLQNDSDTESGKLYKACREYGFFLIDLKDSLEGERLLLDAEKMFDTTAETLGLEREVLDKYAYNPPKDLLGYGKRKRKNEKERKLRLF